MVNRPYFCGAVVSQAPSRDLMALDVAEDQFGHAQVLDGQVVHHGVVVEADQVQEVALVGVQRPAGGYRYVAGLWPRLVGPSP